MPFKSEAQRGYMYIHHPKLAKEFEEATPTDAKLPYHVQKMAEGGEVFPEPQEVDQEGMKDATVPDFLLPYLAGKLPFLKGTAGKNAALDEKLSDIAARFASRDRALPAGIDFSNAARTAGTRFIEPSAGMSIRGTAAPVTSAVESQGPSLESQGLRELWAKAAQEQSGTPITQTAPYVRPDAFQKLAHGGEVHPMEKRGMKEEAGKYADGGEVMPFQFDPADIQAATAPADMQNAQDLGISGVFQPPAATPPTPPPFSFGGGDTRGAGASGNAVPPLGGVMKALSQTPNTNYDFYKNLSADDRMKLFQKLQAQKGSAGNLIAQGAAGIGDAIARSYGGQNTNFQDKTRDIQQSAQDAQLGAFDAERQQKLQDLQANMEAQMTDPNSPMSQSMRKTLKSAGLNVPSGMPGKVMVQIAGPLGELAMKQAQMEELKNYHQQEIGVKKQGIAYEEKRLGVEHPILSAINNALNPEESVNPYAAELARRRGTK